MAWSEIQKYHFTYLHDGWNPDVYDDWMDDGCYDKIADNMGYRLHINFDESDLPDVLPNDGRYRASIKIENTGVSRILNEKKTKILLQGSHDYEFELSDDLRMVRC